MQSLAISIDIAETRHVQARERCSHGGGYASHAHYPKAHRPREEETRLQDVGHGQHNQSRKTNLTRGI